ncbi:MAG TPA: protein kinase [Candidatus Dormibacteraeota bacterium]
MASSRHLEQRSLLVTEARTVAAEVEQLLDPDRWPDAGAAAQMARSLAAQLLQHAAELSDGGEDGVRVDRLLAASWMLDPARGAEQLGDDVARSQRLAGVMRASAATCRSAWRRRRSRGLQLAEIEGAGFVSQALIEAFRRSVSKLVEEAETSDPTPLVDLAGEILNTAAGLFLLERDSDALAQCAGARLCAQLATPLYPGLLPAIADRLETAADDCARELPPAWLEDSRLGPAAPTEPELMAMESIGEPLALPHVGRFVVEAELGRGSMGVVYKGFHPGLGIPVAIKVVHEHSGNQALRQRFAREAASIASLNHPGIVRLFDFDSDQDQLFMVMEYVEGESLESMMQRSGAFELPRALELFEQVLSAVQAAHEEGIVHRDLKPDNVLVSAQGKVKVLDFGVAKLLNDSPELTADGYTVGTPKYMAPEQLGGEAIDARADIYSLGVMLYELIDGEPPFTGTVSAIMHAHVFEPVPSSPRIPEPLMEVIRRAMAKQPSERYSTCAEMAGALRALARTGQLTAAAPQAADAEAEAEPEPVVLQRRCKRLNCQNAGAWMCAYVDGAGDSCETAWCAHHAVFVEDEPYCARHAAVVRALSTSATSNWSLRERPAVDDRAMPLAASLREMLDPDIREMLRRRLQAAGAIQVVADGDVRHVDRDGLMAWEVSWAALRERECLVRVDVRVEAAGGSVRALVNEVPAFNEGPEWIGPYEPGAHDRFTSRLAEAIQVAIDRPLVEPTRAFEVDQPNVDRVLLREILLRLLRSRGPLPPALMADEVALGPRLVGAELRELADTELVEERESDGLVVLTAAGAKRAEEVSRQRRYVGPMPVTAEEYRQVVQREAARPVRDDAIQRALAGIELPATTLTVIRGGVLSGGPLLVYGPGGSGKTALARALAAVYAPVAIPVAIEAAGEVLRVFDPERHRLTDDQPADHRWRRIHAPVIETGTDLTPEQLDPYPGPDALWVPLHVMGNGGVVLIDNLGRQRVPARQLVDRLGFLTERQHVNVVVGEAQRRVALPFHALLVFATAMVPRDILSDFQLRHLPTKVPMHDLDAAALERLLRRSLADDGWTLAPESGRRLHELIGDRSSRGSLGPRLAEKVVELGGSRKGTTVEPDLIEAAWKAVTTGR